jgi:hypothetical protein
MTDETHDRPFVQVRITVDIPVGAVRELVIPSVPNADAVRGDKTTTQIANDAIATSRLRELLADANWRTDEEITWSDAVQYLRRHKLNMADFERDMGEARETWRFAAVLAWAGKQITRRDTQA